MKQRHKRFPAIISMGLLAIVLSGCGATGNNNRQIVRIGHNQATDHPTHIALSAFEEYRRTPWRSI